MEEPKAPGHDIICPKLPTSGMEGPGFELGSTFFLLPLPSFSSSLHLPQHHCGAATLPLPTLFLDVPLLAAAQLNPSVWPNPKSNRRGKKGGRPAQVEGGKERKGVYVGP